MKVRITLNFSERDRYILGTRLSFDDRIREVRKATHDELLYLIPGMIEEEIDACDIDNSQDLISSGREINAEYSRKTRCK